MNTQTYHNSPLKSCRTCVHRIPESFPRIGGLDRCGLGGYYCEVMRDVATSHLDSSALICDINFSGWRPKPPRRSLRRWLYDTFWA